MDETRYVSLAVRDYGAGHICIHTDRVGGVQTGHGENPIDFWRGLVGWTAKKNPNELIKIGLVINTDIHSAENLNNIKPVSVTTIEYSDLSTTTLSNYDCLYFVGLPSVVTTTLAANIATYVNNGGGLVIEYPNRGEEDINILSGIESLYCYSAERALDTLSYWTLDGINHPMFYSQAKITFMSTLRMLDFSTAWTILMSNIENLVTTTTTTSVHGYNLIGKASSIIGISYISTMQEGVVTLEDLLSSTSSESSSSSEYSNGSSSSSSSSSEMTNWDICDNIIAQWKMNDNVATSVVDVNPNTLTYTGLFKDASGAVNTSTRHVPGKINGALEFDSSQYHYVQTIGVNTELSFTNGTTTNYPFTIAFWIKLTTLPASWYVILNQGITGTTGLTSVSWSLMVNDTGAIFFIERDITNTGIYKSRYTNGGALSTGWHFVNIVYDDYPYTRSGTDVEAVKIYVDTVRKDANNAVEGSYTGFARSNSRLYMSYNSSQALNGILDNVIFLDKALSTIEIEALWNKGEGTEACSGIFYNTSSSSSSSTELRSSSSSSSISSSSSSSL